jgi:hypothetical protein
MRATITARSAAARAGGRPPHPPCLRGLALLACLGLRCVVSQHPLALLRPRAVASLNRLMPVGVRVRHHRHHDGREQRRLRHRPRQHPRREAARHDPKAYSGRRSLPSARRRPPRPRVRFRQLRTGGIIRFWRLWASKRHWFAVGTPLQDPSAVHRSENSQTGKGQAGKHRARYKRGRWRNSIP